MPYVSIWLHCVWGTKNRVPFLSKEIQPGILDHMKANARKKGIYLDIINGHSEHVHCLLSLKPDQPLSRVIQLLKGESSFWINKNRLTNFKFEWAVEYYASSVSESLLPKVREYIKNQEEHHRKKSWVEEYNEFLNEYGFNTIKG